MQQARPAARRVLANDFSICPILNGLWQVSGGHGTIDYDKALEAMLEYTKAGFTTFDGADHYGPAEDLMGDFKAKHPDVEIQAFTKWVPRPGPMTREVVMNNIATSLRRMKVDCLDLLQFHWWDYDDNRYLDAMAQLAALQKEGKIKHLGLTNFDTEHLKAIVDSGVRIVSNQVSYSLIDNRPENAMIEYCKQNDIKLLTYGTLLGGLLSDKYLGAPEPVSKKDLNTWSLGKYKKFIDRWGNWALFQELLKTLKQVGDKHSVSIANVAVKYILAKPQIAGVIVGARLGLSDNRQDNLKVFSFELDEEDREAIQKILAKGRALPGDCGDEYRDW